MLYFNIALQKHHILLGDIWGLECCVQYAFKAIEQKCRITLVLQKLISLVKK